MKIQTAKLRYLKIAPRKVRMVTDLIKGLPVNEAEAQLYLLSQRASKPILKLLRSAKTGALSKDMKESNLWLKEIKVDKGPVLKRYRPRARGAVNIIEKKSSHITLILEEKEGAPTRFKFQKKEKKKKEKKHKKALKKEERKEEKVEEKQQEEKREEKREIKTKPTKGFLKKVFRRKAM